MEPYNKIKVISFICILLLASSCSKNKSKNESDFDKEIQLKKESNLKAIELKKRESYGVINEDRIRFRAENNLNSKTLRYLDKGIIVLVIGKDNTRVKIGEMEDYWYHIEYDGISGWVFGYFLDVFSDYDDANSKAKEYEEPEKDNDAENNMYYDEDIDKNLFFLSGGKILQVIDGKNGKARILKTLEGEEITYFFFASKSSNLYYVTKQKKNLRTNGALYSYNIKTERNDLISHNIYTACLIVEKDILLLINLQKTIDSFFWVIKYSDVNSPEEIKEIARIRQKRKNENNENDFFTNTLERELGSLVFLKYDVKGNFIYFKPPEENLSYLVSFANGSYIQVEPEKSQNYEIDSEKYLAVYSAQDDEGNTSYKVILKDRLSGLEKEIISSGLYPLNISTSPKKNLIAITMADLNVIRDNYYSTSIYVLSLFSYSLIPVSTEGKSYQPKWSNNLVK